MSIRKRDRARRKFQSESGWTLVYPGFSAKQRSNTSCGYVRHDATGEIHRTAGPAGRDAVMMALYYTREGDAARAARSICGYLVYCYGGDAFVKQEESA